MDFTLYTKEDYESGWFNELICAELDNFLKDVEAGKMPRLMIFAPPRSGKSELASRRFTAYALGKHPEYDIIATSYAADLAFRMSNDTKRIVSTPKYADVFPDTRLLTSQQARQQIATGKTDLWQTANSDGLLNAGSYKAAGVNGPITGQGAVIGLIDDPAKDYKTASSSTYQTAVKDWYDTTFFTRLNPKKNGVIIILTRWHQLDLAGQLLAEDSSEWKVLSFPMLAEKVEYHEINGKKYKLREPGDILFPERMPLKFVEKCRQRGSLVWNALYQQRPTNKGGGVIKTDWFQYYQVLPKMRWRAIYADTAQKKGEENDFTVFEVWGLGEDNKIYLIDMLRGKFEAWELEIKAPAFWNKHNKSDPKNPAPLRYFSIEDKSSGTGLIQNLSRKALMPINPISRNANSGSKASRVMDIQGYIQSGFVVLPDPSCTHLMYDGSIQTDCSYINDFLFECESFTLEMTHAHDDTIDPMCDAITDMKIDNYVPDVASIL